MKSKRSRFVLTLLVPVRAFVFALLIIALLVRLVFEWVLVVVPLAFSYVVLPCYNRDRGRREETKAAICEVIDFITKG